MRYRGAAMEGRGLSEERVVAVVGGGLFVDSGRKSLVVVVLFRGRSELRRTTTL